MTRGLSAPVVLALGALYFIWGSTYYGMRLAFAELPQLLGSGFRFVIAGTILLLYLKSRGAAWPTRKEWLLAVPIGALMFVFGNGMVAITGRYIGSGIIAVVCATMPLWLAAIGRLFGERQTLGEWVAMLIGLAGVVILASGGELRAQPLMALAIVLAPVGWALGSILAKRWPLAPGLMSAATQMVGGGGVMMLAGVLLHNERPPVQVSGTALFAFAYLVVFGSLVGFSAYTYLLRNVRPTLAVSYAYVNPVLAVLIGASVGHETIAPEAWLASALIVTAVILAIRQRNAGKPAPKPAETPVNAKPASP
ncbi:MAG: drug/metabolite exporter YedA [Deltaproteobacteria bacterium]|nr:drug/metabolite exporter YedA [Deltaproteobacteria bacterium]